MRRDEEKIHFDPWHTATHVALCCSNLVKVFECDKLHRPTTCNKRQKEKPNSCVKRQKPELKASPNYYNSLPLIDNDCGLIKSEEWQEYGSCDPWEKSPLCLECVLFEEMGFGMLRFIYKIIQTKRGGSLNYHHYINRKCICN